MPLIPFKTSALLVDSNGQGSFLYVYLFVWVRILDRPALGYLVILFVWIHIYMYAKYFYLVRYYYQPWNATLG